MRNATVLVLSGDYDARRRDELDHLLDRYGDAEHLVFDMSGVESMDTSALRSLVRFQNARRDAGKAPIVLAAPTPYVRSFLETVRMHETFEVRDEA